MKINKIVVFTLWAFSNAAFAGLLSDCNALASDMNKQLPMAVDKITTWDTSVCIESRGTVTLNYIYTLKVPGNKITQSDLDQKLRDKQLAGWCSNPDQRKLINLVNIEAKYRDQTGGNIGSLVFNNKMCR